LVLSRGTIGCKGAAMEELDAIRKQIEVCFEAGDGAALDRLSLVLNELLADLSLKRALLGQPEPESEQARCLEMVNKDRLDKEIGTRVSDRVRNS
jgi:hypothetical protein